jgi:hypothetical protein
MDFGAGCSNVPALLAPEMRQAYNINYYKKPVVVKKGE